MRPFSKAMASGLTAGVVAGVVAGLAACAGGSAKVDYVGAYLQALDRPVVEQAELGAPARKFLALYTNLSQSGVQQKVADAYAERFHFSDTLVVLRTREALVDYLRETGSNVQASEVSVLDVVEPAAGELYINWTMQVEFAILGSPVVSRSIGMTHLQFDADGKIILHQDFWDSAEGFYQHVPVLGFLIRRVQANMES